MGIGDNEEVGARPVHDGTRVLIRIERWALLDPRPGAGRDRERSRDRRHRDRAELGMPLAQQNRDVGTATEGQASPLSTGADAATSGIARVERNSGIAGNPIPREDAHVRRVRRAHLGYVRAASASPANRTTFAGSSGVGAGA